MIPNDSRVRTRRRCHCSRSTRHRICEFAAATKRTFLYSRKTGTILLGDFRLGIALDVMQLQRIVRLFVVETRDPQ
jgi:hypothetical protein